MHRVVAGVAIVDLAMQGHRPIGTDGDAEEQLFQIGAVVLVVPEGDARRPISGVGGSLSGILAGEGDRRGVLVELGEIDVELTDGPPDQGDQQAGAVGAGEVVEGTSDAVVVEQSDLPGKEAEVFGDAASGPAGDGIERLAGEQEVGQQDG